MVGILVVSHSEKLGTEAIRLCNEMKKNDFKMINAGGIEDGEFGSNPFKIKEAIEEIYTENGILIFVDLGSSIMNTKMAIEFLEEKYDRDKICIADAPIVEGLLVMASINDGKTTLEEIKEELAEFKDFIKD